MNYMCPVSIFSIAIAIFDARTKAFDAAVDYRYKSPQSKFIKR